MRVGGAKRAVLAVALAFALVGCGGNDEPTDTSGATGAQGATGATTDITADEFLLKLLPEKQIAIEAAVAAAAACEGVKVQPSFVLVVSDAASKTDPNTPLTELVEAEC
ncbi:MAG: hypothetical protein M3355_06705 [Actinomycetota bacterium]|nr:hypothetical protein [Actinomycetota bacterium]